MHTCVHVDGVHHHVLRLVNVSWLWLRLRTASLPRLDLARRRGWILDLRSAGTYFPTEAHSAVAVHMDVEEHESGGCLRGLYGAKGHKNALMQ